MRLTSNPKVVGSDIGPAQAVEALASITSNPAHEYWADGPEPSQTATLQSAALVGHRQATGTAAHLELVDARPTVQDSRSAYVVKRKKG